MYVDAETIIMAGSLLTAVVVIFSAVFAVYKWYLKQNQQDVEIERVKSEQCLLTYGMLACLKGLKEQGCNDSVTEAIDKIEKHINKQAHNQGEEELIRLEFSFTMMQKVRTQTQPSIKSGCRHIIWKMGLPISCHLLLI